VVEEVDAAGGLLEVDEVVDAHLASGKEEAFGNDRRKLVVVNLEVDAACFVTADLEHSRHSCSAVRSIAVDSGCLASNC
jgi:hypothetical protein